MSSNLWIRGNAVKKERIQYYIQILSFSALATLTSQELGLDTLDEQPVFRTKANCLRVCMKGPIAVVYPEQVCGSVFVHLTCSLQDSVLIREHQDAWT